MPSSSAFHPAIAAAVRRHREFFAGRRNYLVRVQVPVHCEGLEQPIPFDEMDWDRDYDEYVRVHVENARAEARARLDMGIDDDSIPCYRPRFGTSIHHSFFGGEVTFAGGTSYAREVITAAAQWRELRPDPGSPWLAKLARGLAYGRDHGDGVLVAGYRGGNGPLDMVQGVLGNAIYTEMYDDPEGLHKVVEVCRRATLMTFDVQRRHCTEIDGGHVAPMGELWLPGDAIGHVSLDAACLAGSPMYVEFEKPYVEKIAEQVGGMSVHTHMLGRHCFADMCRTKGILVFAPANDPNQPAVADSVDRLLADAGDVPLMLDVPGERFGEILPKFRGRRAVFHLSAKTADDARGQLEQVDRFCPLER